MRTTRVARTVARRAREGLAVLLITFALVCAVELAGRMVLGGLAYRFDPDYLVALEPDMRKLYFRSPSNGMGVVAWHTNEQGYRGAPLRADPGFRVVVYGDSNVQARFTRRGATFAGQLENELGARTGLDVEVVNAGVIGFGPDQSVIRMRKELTTLRPDLVVLHVLADNDFGDIVRNRLVDLGPAGEWVPAPFPVTVDEALVTGRERGSLRHSVSRLLLVRLTRRALARWRSQRESRVDARRGGPTSAPPTPTAPTPAAPAPAAPEPPPAPATEVSPPGNNRGPSLDDPSLPSLEGEAGSELDRLAHLVEAEHGVFARGAARVYSHFADHYDLDLAVEPGRRSSRDKQALMTAVLARAGAIARGARVQLIVAVQGSARDLTEKPALSRSGLAAFPAYRPENLSEAATAACEAAGVEHVNLFPAFQDSDPEALQFNPPNDHWNDAGQAFAARLVAEAIVDKGMIPVE